MAYSSLPPDALTLRDVLARDRTVLANERTLLSYLRTGLMLALSGVTLLKLSSAPGPGTWVLVLGLCAVGAFTMLWGGFRYVRLQKALRQIPSTFKP